MTTTDHEPSQAKPLTAAESDKSVAKAFNIPLAEVKKAREAAK